MLAHKISTFKHMNQVYVQTSNSESSNRVSEVIPLNEMPFSSMLKCFW